MKVKLLASFAGNDFTHNVGDIISVSEASALRLIHDNSAVPYMPEEELAASEQREKAVTINRRAGRSPLPAR